LKETRNERSPENKQMAEKEVSMVDGKPNEKNKITTTNKQTRNI